MLKLSQKYTTRKQSVMVVVKANRWPDYGKYFSPETLYNPYKQFDTQTLPKKLEKKIQQQNLKLRPSKDMHSGWIWRTKQQKSGHAYNTDTQAHK